VGAAGVIVLTYAVLSWESSKVMRSGDDGGGGWENESSSKTVEMRRGSGTCEGGRVGVVGISLKEAT
jgi:hypothetical protein